MAKKHYRVGRVSSNGGADANERAKGCFGKSRVEKFGYKPIRFTKHLTVDRRTM